MNLDVRAEQAIAQVPEFISEERYAELLKHLKANIDGIVVHSKDVSRVADDHSPFQNVLFFTVQTLSTSYGTSENQDKNNLLDWCLQKLTAKKLLQIWKVTLHRIDSHHFARILVNVLLSRFAELDSQSEEWWYLMYEGALKMQTEFVKEFKERKSSSRFLVERFAEILRFYLKCHDARHLKFDTAIMTIFSEYQPDCVEVQPLLHVLKYRVPFHPYIVYMNRENLDIFVYNPLYLTQQVMRSLLDFINCGTQYVQFIDLRAVNAALDIILSVRHYPDYFMHKFEKLISSLFPYMENFDQGKDREYLVERCIRILDQCCIPRSRCLILKRLAEKFRTPKDGLCMQHSIVAFVIDQYRKHLTISIFQEELGTFYTNFEKIKYDDMVASQPYYMSLINLAQLQFRLRANLGMAQQVADRILQKIKDQLRDFVQIQQVGERQDNAPIEVGGTPGYTLAANIIAFQIDTVVKLLMEWERDEKIVV